MKKQAPPIETPTIIPMSLSFLLFGAGVGTVGKDVRPTVCVRTSTILVAGPSPAFVAA